MELTNTLSNQLTNEKIPIINNQNDFSQSSLWNVVNIGLNTGLRAVLPDLIENQVIQIKDAIIKSGFKEGIKQAVTSANDLGKSAKGIITGDFESIEQAQNAIKKGGIIDSLSEVLNFAIDKAVKGNLINNNVGKTIKKGKNAIINSIESNIENGFNNQINAFEKLNKASNEWKNFYDKQDFQGMEREYNKIKENMEKVLPIENTIKNIRIIENLHLLIKNNGHNFNLSNEELELAGKLI